MKKTDDKQFLRSRAKAAAAARWENHSREVWETIRISRTLKNRLTSIYPSTPSKAIDALVTLYWRLHVLNEGAGLNKKTKVIFDEVKNSILDIV